MSPAEVARVRKAIISIAKVAVVFAVVFLVLYRRIDLQSLFADMRRVPLPLLLAAWALFGCVFTLNTFRWKQMLAVQSIRASLLNLLDFSLIGLFFNNVMLGSMGGDVVKAYYLARKEAARKEAAVTTVVADRIIAFFSFFLIGIAGLVLNAGSMALRPAFILFIAFFLGIIGVLLLLYQRSWLAAIPLFRSVRRRLPFEKNIRLLYEAFYLYKGHTRRVATAVTVALVSQMTFITTLYVLARAMGIHQVTFRHFLILTPLCSTIFAIPILPSGWGTGEIAFVKLFGLLGVPAASALALDLVMRAMIIAWSLVGGILYARPRWRVPKGDLKTRVN